MSHWPDYSQKQIAGQLNQEKTFIPELCNIISNYAKHTTSMKWRFTSLGFDKAKGWANLPDCPKDIQILRRVLYYPGHWVTDNKIESELKSSLAYYEFKCKICFDRIQFLINNIGSFLRALQDVGYVKGMSCK